MRVLFTHSYFLKFDEKQFNQRKPYPPLATIQAAAVIQQKYDVRLFDTNFVSHQNEIKPLLDEYKPDVLVIYDDGFNYLTKMCLTNMRDAALDMIKIASQKGIHVIISSSDSTDHYANYLKAGANEVIIGEGDETLNQLITNIDSNESIIEVEGIAYQNSEEIVVNRKRAVLTSLDDLPLPAWNLIDIDLYKKAWLIHGYFSINLATTRGCPYKCNWCAKPIYGVRYNSRTPHHVISEIKLIQSLFNFDHIWFCDDIFGLRPKWVEEFNLLLKKENITIQYKIQSRADLLLTDENIKNLAESGCDEVWIGAESGSQKILDNMDKGTTIQEIKECTFLMKKHGIKPCFFLQFGYLDELWEDIQATLKMLFKLMPFDIGISVSYPLPGTKFYDMVSSQLIEKTNWTDSNELLLMYKSTYSPKFYKTLHKFVHKRFRQKQIERSFNIALLPKWMYFKLSSIIYYLLLLLQKT
ncbi:MAG: B12-binding domain-containing radical SAM protein [Flavobacteriales bacterium]|nr:B12-binding domain-containing radical SAM protein [Flavobacteriales bacterium]